MMAAKERTYSRSATEISSDLFSMRTISTTLATSAAKCEKLGDRASCSSTTRSIHAADKESQSSENHDPQLA
jgi:hypothetical protein